MCTTTFSSLVCIVGVVALRSVATGQGCDRVASPSKPTEDCDGTNVCDADGTCDVTVLFSGTVDEPQVRPSQGCSNLPKGSDLYVHNHSVPRPVHRAGQLAPSQELALWMFVEFLKLAPLIMGLGCITMVCGAVISVALKEKWLDSSGNGATSKIKWTKPITC